MSSKAVTKALPTQARNHNTAIVLSLLYPSNLMTRADLARATNLTRVVISDIVSELMNRGIVTEEGSEDTGGPGKPGRLLRFNAGCRSIISLDLSQPVFRGAVMDLDAHVLFCTEMEVPDMGFVPLQMVGRLCDELLPHMPSDLLGVGVACPGIVSDDGVVISATHLGWKNMALGEYLQQKMGCPVRLENDANAEAMAEMRFGEGGTDLMLVQLTDGMGAALIMSGKLMRGFNMSTGEIGHVVVDPGGRLCKCGKRGCLETVISTPDILHDIQIHPERSEKILEQSGEYLGNALSVAVGLVDLPKVMLLGDGRMLDKVFLEAVERTINANLALPFRKPVVVHRSTLGDDARLMGVCASVLAYSLAHL